MESTTKMDIKQQVVIREKISDYIEKPILRRYTRHYNIEDTKNDNTKNDFTNNKEETIEKLLEKYCKLDK